MTDATRKGPEMLDVVVHRVASFRIDPHVLRRPGHRLVLVSTEAKHDYLSRTGYRDAFDEICVLQDDFDEAALTAAVRGIAGDFHLEEVALLCHCLLYTSPSPRD